MPAINSPAITREIKRNGAASFSLTVRVAKRFSADRCTTLAASIAFFSAFSLAPMLVMVIAVAGVFYGAEAARGELFARAQGFLGSDAAAAIQAIVEHAHQQGGGGIAAIISIVLLLVGASATFSSLNTALDVVFPAPPTVHHSAIIGVVRTRLISVGLVLGVAFLLLVSLVLDAGVTFIGTHIWRSTSFVVVGNALQLLFSFGTMMVAFGALIKFLPDVSGAVHWRNAIWGGAVSALLFTIGKKLFALYLAHAGTASAFGAAGSLAVLMMWLYFSALVLLLGAEVAAVKGEFAVARAEQTANARQPEIVRPATGVVPTEGVHKVPYAAASAYKVDQPANHTVAAPDAGARADEHTSRKG